MKTNEPLTEDALDNRNEGKDGGTSENAACLQCGRLWHRNWPLMPFQYCICCGATRDMRPEWKAKVAGD